MAMQTGAEVIYPSGFSSYGTISGIKVVKDAEVVRIYTALKQDRGLAENWHFKEKVLESAARLMFPLQNWVIAQRANTLLCKYQLSFVNDTVLVALGGNRPLSLNTRVSMFLDLNVENRVKYSDTAHTDKYLPMANISMMNNVDHGRLLSNLSNTTKKIIDLVDALYVMFGAGE